MNILNSTNWDESPVWNRLIGANTFMNPECPDTPWAKSPVLTKWQADEDAIRKLIGTDTSWDESPVWNRLMGANTVMNPERPDTPWAKSPVWTRWINDGH